MGILNESSGDQTFDNCHAVGARNIAEICYEHKIERLIHFSSIGADINSDAKYQISKGLGEKNVLNNFSKSMLFMFYRLLIKLVKIASLVLSFFSSN